MENCPYCGAPGSYRESADGCCYVCGMMLPESQSASKSTSVELQAEAHGATSSGVTEPPESHAATIELQAPPTVPTASDTVEPPAIKLIHPRNLSPEYARRVTAAWQATKSPFHNPQETLNSSSVTTGDSDKLSIGTRSVAGADDQRPADYELTEVIGEGNMGTVWSARQASLDRHVAVKMPKQSAAKSSLGRELFISEVVVTGQLDHPNIVPIYDLARDESGQLFYAMKRVEGRSWDQCMHEESRTRLDNVEILMKVCDAIRFAHDRGVIHRDIKPQNIMVGKYGEVSVMDWGIALRIDEHLRTPGASKVNPSGTPAYMAPEMATGNAAELGPHTDVYLLGAVLYEIITGEPPHPAPDSSHDPIVQQNACLLLAARNVITPAQETGEIVDIAYKAMATDISDRFQSVDEFQDAIRDYYSHSESIALTDRGQGHLINAAEARNGVYEDYNKARFAFGEAIELWPENSRARVGLAQATVDHASTALKRGDYALGLSLLDRANPAHTELVKKLSAAKRKSDRNRFVALASLVAAISFLIVGVTVSLFLWRRATVARVNAEEQQRIAVDEKRKAEIAERIALDEKGKAEVAKGIAEDEKRKAEIAERIALDEKGKAEVAKGIAEDERGKAEVAKQQETTAKTAAQVASYRSEIGLAAEEVARNAFTSAQSILENQAKNATQKLLRNWEWQHLMYLADEKTSIERFPIEGKIVRVEAVATSPDQKWIAAGTDDGEIHVWLRSGPNKAPLPLPSRIKEHSAPITALAISRDNKMLVSAGGNEVSFWALPTGDLGRGITPAGKSLSYKPIVDGVVTDVSILSVALSPNANIILTSADNATAQLWSPSQPEKPIKLLPGHSRNKVWQARFSPDGQRIVTACDDGIVRIWNAQGNELRKFEGHQGPVYSVEFSADGNYVVSGGRDRRLLSWDLRSQSAVAARGDVVRNQLQNEEESVQSRNYRQFGEHTAAIHSVSFSPDGKTLYSASDDNSVRVWNVGQDMSDALLVKSLRGHGGWVRTCAAAADGLHVLSGSYDGTVCLWNREKYAFPRILKTESEQTRSEDRLTSAATSSDARWIATAAENGAVTMWDMADPLNPKSQLLREGHDWQATTAAYFSNGSKLLTAGGDNSALVWDTRLGNQLLRIGGWNTTGGTGWRGVAAVSHHGRLIATGSDEAETIARLWDSQSGHLVSSLKASLGNQPDDKEAAEATAIAFDLKDETVFIGDQFGRGYVFNSSSGALMKSLGHDGKISAAAFLPNGRLLTASSDRKVAMWNVQSNEAEQRPEREFPHDGRVVAMDVSHDGKLLITAADSNDDNIVLRVWETETGDLKHKLARSGLGPAPKSSDDQPAKPLFVRSVAFHPNQPHAIITVFDPNTVYNPNDKSKSPYQVSKWDWRNNEYALQPQLARLDDTSQAVHAPDRAASILTVGGRGARLRLANQANQVVMSYRPQSSVLSVAFSPDNRLLACAGNDGSIKLWRLDGQTWLPDRKLLGGHRKDDRKLFVGHRKAVRSVAFHPTQSDVLLSAGGDGANIWRRAADDWEPSPLGGKEPVRQAIFSTPDDDNAVIILTVADESGTDKGVKIWSDGGQLVKTLAHGQKVQCVAFSPDRKWIVTGVGSEAWVWDAVTQERSPVPALSGHSADITSLAFSPDAQRLFTASNDSAVKLWDTKPWETKGGDTNQTVSRELLTLKQHLGSVVGVVFFNSATYPSLLTAGADGQAILWPSKAQPD